ncbi:MAG: hypothetical protein RL428_614 [Actinomycetota bacterium]
MQQSRFSIHGVQKVVPAPGGEQLVAYMKREVK